MASHIEIFRRKIEMWMLNRYITQHLPVST